MHLLYLEINEPGKNYDNSAEYRILTVKYVFWWNCWQSKGMNILKCLEEVRNRCKCVSLLSQYFSIQGEVKKLLQWGCLWVHTMHNAKNSILRSFILSFPAHLLSVYEPILSFHYTVGGFPIYATFIHMLLTVSNYKNTYFAFKGLFFLLLLSS